MGHSLHAPVGLSAKKKDPQWFTKPPTRQNTESEQLKKIQQQEAIIMRATLQGIPIQDAIALALEQSNGLQENEVVVEKENEKRSSPRNETHVEPKRKEESDQRCESNHRRHSQHRHHRSERHSKRRHKTKSSRDRKRRHHS